MSGKTIATIYFFVISAASLVLIVIGIFNAVNFVINSTQYEKYPLRYGGVSNCEFTKDYPIGGGMTRVMVEPAESVPATSNAEVDPQARERCLANEEEERRQHRVDDLKNAITFTLVGVVLFLIHFPQARKRSQ